MITLSRNKPVALIVGVAGFLGSHLSEKLLSKDIQVVGVDDLSSGNKDNLEIVVKNRDFHFINQPAISGIPDDLPRLDYAFFSINEEVEKKEYLESFESFLKICKQFKPKVVLISSIQSYDADFSENSPLPAAEKKLALMSVDNKINARVVRLAAVFGPRMHFRENDPIVRLIHSDLSGSLQKETTALDFTTRALYISDAIELLIKAVMHGSTAHKLYDGALLSPIKVTEIKQVLLDPVWYESKGFIPTELPPWPTPNLLKTQKELSWKNSLSLVASLKETIHFFKDHPDLIEREPKKKMIEKEIEEDREPVGERKQYLPPTFMDNKKVQKRGLEALLQIGRMVKILLITGIISYATIYPLTTFLLATVSTQNQLKATKVALASGDFELAENGVKQAKIGVGELRKSFNIIKPLGKITIFSGFINSTDQVINLLEETTIGADNSVKGAKSLGKAFKNILGEEEVSDIQSLAEGANINFSEAQNKFEFVKSKTNDKQFINYIGKQTPLLGSGIQNELENLGVKVGSFQQDLKTRYVISLLLPKTVLGQGKRSYLVLLVDNRQYHQGGGIIKSIAEVSFDNGKLTEAQTVDIDKLDSINEPIDPPQEVKEIRGVKQWGLKEANLDVDFPTAARSTLWLYHKQSGKLASGVITLDLQAFSQLSESLGGIPLINTAEKISGPKLIEKVSQSNENILTPYFQQFLNMIFFSKNDFQEFSEILIRNFEEKHLAIYMSDPSLLNYLAAEKWISSSPKETKERAGERQQLLAYYETSLASEFLGWPPSRQFNLESNILSNGGAKHKLTVNYKSSDRLIGAYKSRVKIYLLSGSKLTQAQWGGVNIFPQVNAFVDFGRTGYSFFLDLGPGQAKDLVLEYEDGRSLTFVSNNLKYNLNIIKQLGAGNDKFNFKLNLPNDIYLIDENSKKVQNYTTIFELLRDQNLEFNLQKGS